MEKQAAREMIQEVVISLCVNCDPECPISRLAQLGPKLPDCYAGDGGRDKVDRLQRNTPIDDLDDESFVVLDEVFSGLLK